MTTLPKWLPVRQKTVHLGVLQVCTHIRQYFFYSPSSEAPIWFPFSITTGSQNVRFLEHSTQTHTYVGLGILDTICRVPVVNALGSVSAQVSWGDKGNRRHGMFAVRIM